MDEFDSFFATMKALDEDLSLAAASVPLEDGSGPMEMIKVSPLLSPIRDPLETDDEFLPNFEPSTPIASSNSDGELEESPNYEPKSPTPPPSPLPKDEPKNSTFYSSAAAAAAPLPKDEPKNSTPPAAAAATIVAKKQCIPRRVPQLAVKRKISPVRPPTPKKKFVRRPKRPNNVVHSDAKGAGPERPNNVVHSDAKGAGPERPNNVVDPDTKGAGPLRKYVDPAAPSQSRAPWKPQKSYRPTTSQIIRHSINYVLAIREGEFVLTDGYRSIYKCHPQDWIQQLKMELNCLVKKVRSLFCADRATFNWLSSLKQHWEPNHPINRIPVHVWDGCSELGPCSFCMRTNCVRWLAVRGGVQKFFRYEIDMMEH